MTHPILAGYIHQFSPYALQFSQNIALRWYGIAYVLGFYIGMWLLKHYSRSGRLRVPEAKVEPFIFFVALFGVILGGRLGFFLLYHRQTLIDDPLSFFRFQEGGMASHGGITAVVITTFIFAKLNRLNWRNLGDHLVIAAPIGIFCGRIANFINGELWGKKTNVAWAVKFPEELSLFPDQLPPDSTLHTLPVDSIIRTNFQHLIYKPHTTDDGTIEFSARKSHEIAETAQNIPGAWDEFSRYLTPRHPSQLYQALLEGALLFLFLFWIRRKYPNLKDGVLCGLFFLGYALARITGETWRFPSDGLILGISAGQFFTLFFILIGVTFLATASKNTGPTPKLPPP